MNYQNARRAIRFLLTCWLHTDIMRVTMLYLTYGRFRKWHSELKQHLSPNCSSVVFSWRV